VDLSGKGFGKQFERAAKLNAAFAVIIGEAEAQQGNLQLKNLKTGEQQTLTRAEFTAFHQALT